MLRGDKLMMVMCGKCTAQSIVCSTSSNPMAKQVGSKTQLERSD